SALRNCSFCRPFSFGRVQTALQTQSPHRPAVWSRAIAAKFNSSSPRSVLAVCPCPNRSGAKRGLKPWLPVSLFSRLAHRVGLVTLRQTFVRRCHGGIGRP